MRRTRNRRSRSHLGALASLAGSILSFGLLGLVRASMVLAQVQAPESEIPENAPKNWTIQFVAQPLVLVAVLLAVACVIVYAWRMIRLRYPRSA